MPSTWAVARHDVTEPRVGRRAGAGVERVGRRQWHQQQQASRRWPKPAPAAGRASASEIDHVDAQEQDHCDRQQRRARTPALARRPADCLQCRAGDRRCGLRGPAILVPRFSTCRPLSGPYSPGGCRGETGVEPNLSACRPIAAGGGCDNNPNPSSVSAGASVGMTLRTGDPDGKLDHPVQHLHEQAQTAADQTSRHWR